MSSEDEQKLLNDCFGKALTIVDTGLDIAVTAFGKRHDLTHLVRKLVRISESAREVTPAFGLTLICAKAGDRLHEDNAEVIKRAARVGVFPGPNVVGTRLESTSCLWQLTDPK
jgi:hypothetical protein